MSNMICTSCGCGCLILPYSCLYKRQQRLQDLGIENYPEILDATNGFVLIGDEKDGLLGHNCFVSLCGAIKDAQSMANEYNENTVNATGPETEFWFYLDGKWSTLLNNSYFQMMYAAYAMYYYYFLGIASSDTSKTGDYEHALGGKQVNDGDGGKNITLSTSDKKGQKMLTLAKFYANLFKQNFWSKNKSKYGCNSKRCGPCNTKQSCSCNKSNCSSCNPYPEKPKIKRPRFFWL